MRLLRRIVIGVLLVVAAAGLGAAVLWRMADAAPRWWSPPDPADAAVAQRADDVVFRVVEQAHKVRPLGERWTMRVPDDEVNAWLAGRLPAWIESQPDLRWPEALGTPQVRTSESGLDVAIELGAGAPARYLVARVRPEIVGSRLRLTVERLGLGRVALPAGQLARLLEQSGHADLERALREPVVRALLGERLVDTAVTLADDRRVRLSDVRCEPGALVLTCVTEGDGARQAPRGRVVEDDGGGGP